MHPLNLYAESHYGGSVKYIPLSEEEINKNYFYKNNLVTKVRENNKYFLLFGIPFNSENGQNTYNLQSQTSNKVLNIHIDNKNYEVQQITIKKYKTRSEDELKRIKVEKSKIIDAKKRIYNHYPDLDFIIPTKGKTSGVFGTQRYYNGIKGKFHNGHDIAAQIGTPIIAPSDGKVMLIGDYYFNGKFVMINHGYNLISMFLHMNKIQVEKGQLVKKGEIIGTVGNTGMSTGPHLHWSVLTNNEYIDPLILVKKRLP